MREKKYQGADGPFRWVRGVAGAFVALALALFVVTAAAAFGGAEAWAQDAAPAADAAAVAPADAVPAEAPVAEDAALVAEEEVVEDPGPSMDKGDVSWLLTSTALVVMMTLPGLALFYGGLVRAKNMLSMLMQVSTVVVIGMMCWVFWGYSLAFTDGGALNKFVGGTSKMFLAGVDPSTMVETFSPNVMLPELLFVAFQMTFAAITAALVLGGVAERMKFSGVIVFAVLWPILSYYPLAHMVWWWSGATSAIGQSAEDLAAGAGQIWAWGALDFAGGTVVHINAGVAALVGALILGARHGYKAEPMPPHSLPLTFTGAGLLWAGWFGFNVGSNLEANGYAALAFVNTLVATAAAGFSWILVEWVTRKRPSGLGMASGLIAGLVAVTPAAGLIGPVGAIVLGLIASPVCVLFCSAIKSALKFDDSLDVFGIHAVAGVIGAIGTGFLVNPALGGAGVVDFAACTPAGCGAAVYDMAAQVTAQVKAVGLAIVWSGVASAIVFTIIKVIGQLRVSKETELEGLDISEHGERAYHA